MNLDEIQDLVFILCAAFGELREPDLPAVPLMEQLQPLHHLVGLAAVVVSGEVVNPAAQGLARLQGRIQGDCQFWLFRISNLEKWIKPVCVSCCRRRTDQSLQL